MKAKIILIPLLTMSCLLGSCEKAGEFITVGEYLDITNDEGTGYFTVNNITTKDYECTVQNIFKKYIKDLTKESKYTVPQEECESISFDIAGDYKYYSSFSVIVFSIGQVNTYCSGSKKAQETTYLIDEQIAKSLIKEVKDRYDEIVTIIAESEQTAIEEHNVDQFFMAANALTNKTFKYYDLSYDNNTGQLIGSQSYTINDTDGSLTDELMAVGYNYMPLNHSTRKDYSIEYKINDNWYFRLFSSNYYVATVTYKYSNPFYDTEVQMDYNVNDREIREKVDTFINNVRSIAIK